MLLCVPLDPPTPFLYQCWGPYDTVIVYQVNIASFWLNGFLAFWSNSCCTWGELQKYVRVGCKIWFQCLETSFWGLYYNDSPVDLLEKGYFLWCISRSFGVVVVMAPYLSSSLLWAVTALNPELPSIDNFSHWYCGLITYLTFSYSKFRKTLVLLYLVR